MKLIVIKKNLQKGISYSSCFCAKGMYINLIPVWDKGQRGGGRFFIKEQWEKSLLPLGPDSNNGYLLH